MENSTGAVQSREALPEPIRLTPRELQVLRLIANSKSTKQVADELGISFKTAVSHRTSLMKKAGAHDVLRLFCWAVENGFCDGPQPRGQIGPPEKKQPTGTGQPEPPLFRFARK